MTNKKLSKTHESYLYSEFHVYFTLCPYNENTVLPWHLRITRYFIVELNGLASVLVIPRRNDWGESA